jgi:hypothetical protein
MRSLWVAIDSRTDETRILVTAGPKETVLKARLLSAAQHPRAVPTRLEALAMWHGIPVFGQWLNSGGSSGADFHTLTVAVRPL